MSISGHRDSAGRPLSTADLAAAARRREISRPDDRGLNIDDGDATGTYVAPPISDVPEGSMGSSRETEVAAASSDRPGLNTDRPAASAERRPSHSARGGAEASRGTADADRRADTESQLRGNDRPAENALPPGQSPLGAAHQDEALEPLFTPVQAESYRVRWTSIQGSFVDNPRQAVRNGDELVAQIMTNLANTFAEERHRVEVQLDDAGEASTENLRVALQRYRSFFERLLSL